MTHKEWFDKEYENINLTKKEEGMIWARTYESWHASRIEFAKDLSRAMENAFAYKKLSAVEILIEEELDKEK